MVKVILNTRDYAVRTRSEVIKVIGKILFSFNSYQQELLRQVIYACDYGSAIIKAEIEVKRGRTIKEDMEDTQKQIFMVAAFMLKAHAEVEDDDYSLLLYNIYQKLIQLGWKLQKNFYDERKKL